MVISCSKNICKYIEEQNRSRYARQVQGTPGRIYCGNVVYQSYLFSPASSAEETGKKQSSMPDFIDTKKHITQVQEKNSGKQ